MKKQVYQVLQAVCKIYQLNNFSSFLTQFSSFFLLNHQLVNSVFLKICHTEFLAQYVSNPTTRLPKASEPL